MLSEHWFLIHHLLRRSTIGGDETDIGENTVGYGKNPDKTPEGTEGKSCVSKNNPTVRFPRTHSIRPGDSRLLTLVCPSTGRMEPNPDECDTGDQPKVNQPGPRLEPQQFGRPDRLRVMAHIGSPPSRMKLRKEFGVGRVRYRRSNGRTPPVDQQPTEMLEIGPFLGGSRTDRSYGDTRSVHDTGADPSDKFEWHRGGVVGFGDEETIPDPFTEVKTDPIEDMVCNPGSRQR